MIVIFVSGLLSVVVVVMMMMNLMKNGHVDGSESQHDWHNSERFYDDCWLCCQGLLAGPLFPSLAEFLATVMIIDGK
jgi:hypothetical protein